MWILHPHRKKSILERPMKLVTLIKSQGFQDKSVTKLMGRWSVWQDWILFVPELWGGALFSSCTWVLKFSRHLAQDRSQPTAMPWKHSCGIQCGRLTALAHTTTTITVGRFMLWEEDKADSAEVLTGRETPPGPVPQLCGLLSPFSWKKKEKTTH